MKRLICKLFLKFFRDELYSVLSLEAHEESIKTAVEAGYEPKDAHWYYADQEQQRNRPIFDAGVEEGFRKAMLISPIRT